jgi:hypothetical protein
MFEEGLFGKRSVFVRNPKFAVNTVANTAYLDRRLNWINDIEVMILCYFIYGIGLSIYWGDYFMMLFFIMIGYGLGFLLYKSGLHLSFQSNKVNSLSTLKAQ